MQRCAGREEKTTFEVVSKKWAQQIGVIKEVRAAVPGIGLAEAKPCEVRENLKEGDQAERRDQEEVEAQARRWNQSRKFSDRGAQKNLRVSSVCGKTSFLKIGIFYPAHDERKRGQQKTVSRFDRPDLLHFALFAFGVNAVTINRPNFAALSTRHP